MLLLLFKGMPVRCLPRHWAARGRWVVGAASLDSPAYMLLYFYYIRQISGRLAVRWRT
jgi:hypothetical protein